MIRSRSLIEEDIISETERVYIARDMLAWLEGGLKLIDNTYIPSLIQQVTTMISLLRFDRVLVQEIPSTRMNAVELLIVAELNGIQFTLRSSFQFM